MMAQFPFFWAMVVERATEPFDSHQALPSAQALVRCPRKLQILMATENWTWQLWISRIASFPFFAEMATALSAHQPLRGLGDTPSHWWWEILTMTESWTLRWPTV